MGVLSNNYAQIVPGALISASYVSDIYEVLMGSEPETLKVTGSLTVTGSIISTAGVTASLQGTSSWAVSASRAVSALTASYAVSASYLNYINTSSQSDTAITASYALTASYVVNSVSSSFASNSVTASYSETSSYVPTYINDASISGTTLTFTKGDSTTVDVTIPGGSVNYANVFFVDSTNGNNDTGLVNNFTKPFATVGATITGAYYTSPTSASRALVYVRRGTYNNETMAFYNNVDVYCEPGVVFIGSSNIYDYATMADSKFMGYAKFINTSAVKVCKATGAGSTIYFECDEIIAYGGVFEIQNGANIYFKARKIDADGYTFLETGYLRGSGNIVIEISEEYKSFGQHIKFVQFSGKAFITCPRMFLKDGGPHTSNQKQIVMCDANAGGEAVINGNMYAATGTTYYGGISGIITRWNDSWMTLRFNGGIFSENQLSVNAQGSSAASRTIINGDVRTNFQIAYIASNSRVVFRNGTIMNWNSEVTSSTNQYPIMHVNENAVTFIDNCHLHNLGTASFSALWKSSTTSDLNVYNTIYSGADTTGSFIKNTASGTPTSSVRLHNVRSSKALDTNITDLLSPTGFIYDTNITSINFI